LTCPACESFNAQPLSGVYRLTCLQCCARLVLSTQPDKRQANVMLAAIARQPGAPGRAEVLECVAHELTKRRSAPAKSGTVSRGVICD
jgi:hypothetical protein